MEIACEILKVMNNSYMLCNLPKALRKKELEGEKEINI